MQKLDLLASKILKFLRKIKKSFSTYKPIVEVLVFQNNLIHNLNEFRQKYPKLAFAPVLKSNAYGHGLAQVAQILDKEKIAFFVVDSLFEAKALRNEGIKSKILIVGYTDAKNICSGKISNTAFTITSLEQLQEVQKYLKDEKKFHLKIDTGMHRQGILPEQIEEAIKIIKNNKFIILEGICSHLADADGMEKTFTEMQIERWEKAVEIFKQNFKTVRYFHLAATAGTNYSDKFSSNVARLGLGLYGINSSSFAKLNLKPVLRMQSIISSVKTINVGECVGYNATYKAEKTMRIATVPVGYFEGVDRRLSNSGFFKIGNYNCPIIGRISMNIVSIDTTSIVNAKLGDPVIIISENPQDKNSVENISKLIQAIPYEILVHIPAHLKRKVA